MIDQTEHNITSPFNGTVTRKFPVVFSKIMNASVNASIGTGDAQKSRAAMNYANNTEICLFCVGGDNSTLVSSGSLEYRAVGY